MYFSRALRICPAGMTWHNRVDDDDVVVVVITMIMKRMLAVNPKTSILEFCEPTDYLAV